MSISEYEKPERTPRWMKCIMGHKVLTTKNFCTRPVNREDGRLLCGQVLKVCSE